MYSLVSASVLGYDLSRLPGGDAVSAVLRRALALGPADLPRLVPDAGPDAGLDAEPRLRARSTALGEARRLVRTPDALHAAVTHLADAPRRRVALGLLERASLGHVDALVRLVRADLLDWTWRGDRELAVRGP
ncbi:MAG: hypothetical protein M3P95_02130, partial [Actinomycetota bacterium]|nr:hypothetical protein [Actinomycetota bacterium]